MRAFVNEVALAEACATDPASHELLETLLETRQRYPVLGQALYCARGLPNTAVRGGRTLADIVRRLPRDKVSLAFQWLVNKGPFIENDRQPIEPIDSDDVFVFGQDDVTDLGIGEAARRILASKQAVTLSTIGGTTSRFAGDLLRVIQGLPDDPLNVVDVPNYTDAVALATKLSGTRPLPRTWTGLLALCREDFDQLNIGSYCERVILRHPYSASAGRKIRELFEVLQLLMTELDASSGLSALGVQIREKYFVGERAWFTDESATRKKKKQTFTFPDPDGGGTLVCYWHGKVSTGSLRVHFEWPIERPSERLRVVYIGPHL